MRRANRTELERADERVAGLDEILDLVIHELRNPVAVLKGFASSIGTAAEKMDPEAMKKAAKAIHRGADRLDALLSSLADVRSLDEGSLQIHPENVLLSEIVRGALEGQTLVTLDHRISVHIEDDVLLHADPVRIRQVLTNLISNAVKFSPRDSSVEITASREDDEAHICVKDEGPGIPVARADAVFDKFTRLNATVNGSGIGLYISRGIARAHGGELELAETDGRGCTFLLRLPIHGDAEKDPR